MDGADALSRVSGVPRDEVFALWEQVKANHKRLDECQGPHVFVSLTPEKQIGQRFRCDRCQGEADGVHVHWYRLGLAHGQR